MSSEFSYRFEETTFFLYVRKIAKSEMGGACDTYGGRERCAQGFCCET